MAYPSDHGLNTGVTGDELLDSTDFHSWRVVIHGYAQGPEIGGEHLGQYDNNFCPHRGWDLIIRWLCCLTPANTVNPWVLAQELVKIYPGELGVVLPRASTAPHHSIHCVESPFPCTNASSLLLGCKSSTAHYDPSASNFADVFMNHIQASSETGVYWSYQKAEVLTYCHIHSPTKSRCIDFLHCHQKVRCWQSLCIWHSHI